MLMPFKLYLPDFEIFARIPLLSNEGSGESVHMHRLARAIAACNTQIMNLEVDSD